MQNVRSLLYIRLELGEQIDYQVRYDCRHKNVATQFVDSTEYGFKSLRVVRVEKIQKFKGEVVALLTILLIVIDNIFYVVKTC